MSKTVLSLCASSLSTHEIISWLLPPHSQQAHKSTDSNARASNVKARASTVQARASIVQAHASTVKARASSVEARASTAIEVAAALSMSHMAMRARPRLPSPSALDVLVSFQFATKRENEFALISIVPPCQDCSLRERSPASKPVLPL